jgi:hypothetical protein
MAARFARGCRGENMTEEQKVALVLETLAAFEEAKAKLEALRSPVFAEAFDGRALSVAVTYLETAELWVANAKR